MKLVNRQAAVVYRQQPFANWINTVEEQSRSTTGFRINEANREPHVYLLEQHED